METQVLKAQILEVQILEAQILEAKVLDVANGGHERCNNPICRSSFPFLNGKFQRVKGLDSRYYCDSHCASGPYLTARTLRQ